MSPPITSAGPLRRPRARRRLGAGLLALAFLAGVPASAAAVTETEPNNNPVFANGPLGADGKLEGSVASSDLRDYTLVNFPPFTQVGLKLGAIEDTEANTGCVRATIRPLLGGTTSVMTLQNRTSDEEYSETAYTTGPAGLRGILDVRPCFTSGYGATYSIEITPPTALVATPAQSPSILFNPEPNEIRTQAAGPLAPGWIYQGFMDTTNDQDWFQFWVPVGPHQISLQAMEFGGDANVTWYAAESTTPIASTRSNDLLWGNSDVTINGPVVVFGRVTGTFGSPYALRVEPADPLGVTTDINVLFPPPPPPPPAPPIPPAAQVLGATVKSRKSIMIKTTSIANGDVLTVNWRRKGRSIATRTVTVTDNYAYARAPTAKNKRYDVTITHKGTVLASTSIKVRR